MAGSHSMVLPSVAWKEVGKPSLVVNSQAMKRSQRMPFDEAFDLVCRNLGPRELAPRNLSEGLGLPLAEALLADRDFPPFHRAAMDGYALRGCELRPDRRWPVVGRVLAGEHWEGPLPEGTALKIMTGAAVPEALDSIVQVEWADEEGGQVAFSRLPSTGANIHRRGTDARAGSELCPAGKTVTPAVVALAAAVGRPTLLVPSPVATSVVSTGTELVSSLARPAPWQIRDLNGPFLEGALRSCPLARFVSRRLAADDFESLGEAVDAALDESEMLLLSGGVSEGDRDLVPSVLDSLGVSRLFHKLALRPGNPLWVGLSRKGAPVFALPGNPVAVRVLWQIFVLPALRTWMGDLDPFPQRQLLPLGASVRFRPGYRRFVLARLAVEEGRTVVFQESSQGSGDFLSASRAHGLMVFDERAEGADEGDLVAFLPW